jgi:hypothetical protein
VAFGGGRLEEAVVSCTTVGGPRVYYFLRVELELHDGYWNRWMKCKFCAAYDSEFRSCGTRRARGIIDQAFLPS